MVFFCHQTGHRSNIKLYITIMIGLACVIPLGKIVKILNHFSLFFQKTRIKDCFKFSIPDFDICLNILQLQILKWVLFLNGISIIVVIDSWLKQYMINLTKLAHA